MFEELGDNTGAVLAYRVGGKVTREELGEIETKLVAAIDKFGKVRVLVELTGLSGMEPGAFWEDLKFTLRHGRDIERLAVVGDQNWERWWTKIAGKLSGTDVEYFEVQQRIHAWHWLENESD